MSLKPKEDAVAEVHKLDPFFRVETGSGEAVLDGVTTAIQAGFAVVDAAGTRIEPCMNAGVGDAAESALRLRWRRTGPWRFSRARIGSRVGSAHAWNWRGTYGTSDVIRALRLQGLHRHGEGLRHSTS